MSVTEQLVGVSQEVLQDERVQDLVAKIDAKGDGIEVASLLTAPEADLSHFGIKLRTSGLMQQAMLVRVISALKRHGLADVQDKTGTVTFSIADEYQPFLWTFLLGAPLKEVYSAMDVLDREGLPPVMERVHNWFDSLNVPKEAGIDVLNAMARSFDLAMRAMGSVPSDGSDEKKVQTG